MTDEALSIKQLADLLSLSERTVYRLANKGEIPGFRVGNSWRFKRSRVEEWMDEQTERTRRQTGGPKRQAKRKRRPSPARGSAPTDGREEGA